MSVQQEKFTEIANAIRSKLGTTDLIKPSDFAKKIGEIQVGGGDSWYDTFWDTYHLYSKTDGEAMRFDWRYAFAGLGWKDAAYNPKYPIVIKGSCEGMYQVSSVTKKVTVNTTECTSARTMFYYCKTTAIGELDLQKCTNTQFLCSNATNLVSIDKIIPSATTTWEGNTFEKCSALTHVIFEGEIAKNGLNLQWSKLDVESLKSLLDCLVDKAEDTSGTEWKVTVGSLNFAKIEECLSTELDNAHKKGWYID